MDNTDIFLVPSVNPDGFEMESRYNVNEEDLNRAFPGWRDMALSKLLKMKNWIYPKFSPLETSFLRIGRRR